MSKNLKLHNFSEFVNESAKKTEFVNESAKKTEFVNESTFKELYNKSRWIDRWEEYMPENRDEKFFIFETLCQKMGLRGFVITSISNPDSDISFGFAKIRCFVVDAGFEHTGTKNGAFYYFSNKDAAEDFRNSLIDLISKHLAFQVGRYSLPPKIMSDRLEDIPVRGYELFEIADRSGIDMDKFFRDIRGAKLGNKTGIVD